MLKKGVIKLYKIKMLAILSMVTIVLLMVSSVSACDCNLPEQPMNASELFHRFMNIIKTNIGRGTTFEGLSSADIAALQKQGENEGWTFTVGENSATKYSLDELCGLVEPKNWWIDAKFDPCTPRGDLPDYFDWRDYDGCTPVKNQASCGSCWAFSTVGPLECNIKIKDGMTVDLSEQWLVSCNSDGWSCSGGWYAHDYHQWKTDPYGDTGAVLEQYFPYVADDVPCNGPYPHDYLIDDWAYIGSSQGIPPVDSIKQAILDYGPVSVAVYANSAMQSYTGGIFSGCGSGQVNHAVVLVGWDDNQGSNGVWFMRNSWGTNWGEDGGYMRIPYDCSSIGYAACYIEYPGTSLIKINLPDGVPEIITPGVSTNITVQIEEINDTYIPGTGKIHYRYDGGTYLFLPLVSMGSDLYEATLPPATCGDTPEYYFSAEGNSTGVIYNPSDAPATVYSSFVGEFVTLFTDDFEADKGWTVYSGATTGNWERANPQEVDYGGTITQPEDDHTPNGTLCFVTGPLAGSSAGSYDVDDGPTRLTSPVFDLGNTETFVSYWRWYHISTVWDDELVVEISNDNGTSWVTVESIDNRETWTHVKWRVSDYVTPTTQVRIRFTADDTPNNSLVEALIDDFRVSVLECGAPTIVDNSYDATGTGDNFIVNATISDDDGINGAWVEYWFGAGSKTTVSMINIGGDYWEYDHISIPTSSVDDLYYNISAKDNNNNWGYLNDQHVIVIDNDPPEISDVTANPPSAFQGDFINITVKVIDNIEVDEVYLYVSYPDSSVANFSITQNKTDSTYYCNKTYNQIGVYTYHIWTNDSSGNINISNSYNFEIINTPPYTPSNPNPANHATNVDNNADLSWTGGDPNPGDTVTYDVYFDIISPPAMVVNNQSGTSYNPGIMDYEQTYYWKIVSWDDHGASVDGPIWDFTTESAPPNETPIVSNENPSDNSIDVPITISSVSVLIEDPEGDSFDWSIETSPDIGSSSGAGEYNGTKTCTVSSLDYTTTYTWYVNATDSGSGEWIREIYTFITESISPHEPNLECYGMLSWTSVNPGATVTGSFTVNNIGDPGSELDWEITEWPTWGTWTFNPSNGDDLTPEDGPVTVNVSVMSPNQPNQQFSGEVKIINKDNSSDCELIMASLATPINQNSASSHILQFLQKISQQFPTLKPMLSSITIFNRILYL